MQLPVFNPNLIELGFVQIKYYSLAYILGIMFSWFIIKKINNTLENKIFSATSKFLDDFVSYLVFGIILGGRLGYVFFYNFNYYSEHLKEIFMIWQGGMAFHGAFIGVLVSGYFLCKKHKIDFFKMSDLCVITIPIALFLGRIANFINLELYGKPTTVKWGMIFPGSDGQIRHPSQLYEAFLEGICLFLILFIITKITKLKYKYLNTSIFFIFYAIFRFIVEFFREPDIQIGYIFKYFTMGQILSIPIFLTGCYLFYLSLKNSKDNGRIQENN